MLYRWRKFGKQCEHTVHSIQKNFLTLHRHHRDKGCFYPLCQTAVQLHSNILPPKTHSCWLSSLLMQASDSSSLCSSWHRLLWWVCKRNTATLPQNGINRLDEITMEWNGMCDCILSWPVPCCLLAFHFFLQVLPLLLQTFNVLMQEFKLISGNKHKIKETSAKGKMKEVLRTSG